MNRRAASAGLLAMLLGPRAVPLLASVFDARPGHSSVPVQPASFPLGLSENRRYLVDAAGRPFLMTGDAAWSLIAQLTREEADLYLAHRREQGFNTLLVNLIEHKFSSNAPANAYGEAPFRAAGGVDEPNERYFDHAHSVVRLAREQGFLVLLVPAYLGWQGGPEGWYEEMKAAGPATLLAYGRYLAGRFGGLDNVIWVHGGDFDDPDRSLANAVAAGISAVAPRAIHTVHGAPDTVTPLYWKGERWLSIDTVYTYGDVFRAVSAEYSRAPPMPVLLVESRYENEGDGDEQRMREQAYGAILGGAAGQIFGNSPVWHFSARDLPFGKPGWRRALDSPGAASIRNLARLFGAMEWWKIAPDDGAVLVAPKQGEGARAFCGVATDASFAVVYSSGHAKLTVKLPWSGEEAASRLSVFDPAAGRAMVETPPLQRLGDAIGVQLPEQHNAGGFSDWVLVAARPA